MTLDEAKAILIEDVLTNGAVVNGPWCDALDVVGRLLYGSKYINITNHPGHYEWAHGPDTSAGFSASVLRRLNETYPSG